MAQAPRLKVYDGINDLLDKLRERGQTLAIVTKSPDMVPKAFIKQRNWPIDIIVGYHHVRNRKPDPEGLLLAMAQAGATPGETFHVGDQPEDTAASRAAKVTAIASAWGVTDVTALKASEPDYLFMSVGEMQSFFLKTP